MKNLIIIFLILFINQQICFGISNKKGTTFGSDLESDQAKCNDIKDLNVKWYYNWSKWPTCQKTVQNVEFVPQIWGRNDLPIGSFNGSSSDWLLGFNEPNYGDQANMEPKEAAQLWPNLEATGKKLVGPGLADCGNSLGGQCTYSTLNWYSYFIGNCTELYGSKGCRVDAVSLHLYYCDADDMINKINNLYQATKKPVWLTEFACNAADNNDKVVNFAKKLLPLLENSTVVERYSWFLPFCGGCSTSNLLLSSLFLDQKGNNNLSSIGKFYSNFTVESNNGGTITTTSSNTTSNGGPTTGNGVSTTGNGGTTTGNGGTTTGNGGTTTGNGGTTTCNGGTTTSNGVSTTGGGTTTGNGITTNTSKGSSDVSFSIILNSNKIMNLILLISLILLVY